MPTPETISSLVEEVFDLFDQFGRADYIGEAISQLEHACQAAHLAEKEGFDNEVILAALFHDIGHLYAMKGSHKRMGDYGIMEHEKLGADLLRKLGFSERVASLVESHVAAKRYLCATDSTYFEKLSDASVHTLKYQGGPMTKHEVQAFEAEGDVETKVRLRHWDELAKEVDISLPDMNRYKKLAEQHLSEQ